MKKLNFLFILLFASAFYACDKEISGPTYVDANPDNIKIRIDNQSKFLLKSLNLNTGSNERTYGDILPNRNTKYRSFRYAYPTFSLSFEVGSKQFEYLDSNQTNYDKVEAGKYDALIYEIDTVLKTFAFRLEES